jgi:hypothetical protein
VVQAETSMARLAFMGWLPKDFILTHREDAISWHCPAAVVFEDTREKKERPR